MASASWTAFVPSERDILITKVQRGELTPQAAEDEAGRLGQEPFEVSPNPADFDPMEEASWSLPMVLAWIMWRTTDPVREMWDSYREQHRFWFFQPWHVPGGQVYEGHFLKEKEPAALLDIVLLEGQCSHPNVSGMGDHLDAFRSLRNKAQIAKWKASGVVKSERREIEPFEWADFQICDTQSRAGSRRAVLRNGQSSAQIEYNNVLVPLYGLKKSFPASGAPKRGRPQVIQYDVLKREFLRLMDKHGDVSRDDPEWNSKDKVIAALERFYSEKRKAEVSRSALQPKVAEWLDEWRRASVARK